MHNGFDNAYFGQGDGLGINVEAALLRIGEACRIALRP